ncbi:MAG: transcriptional repressor [Bacteroidales bacterium]|nr:transcriptional repressor [Bacteroidales bacterium]
MNEIFSLLEKNKLSRTPCRIEVLKTLKLAGSALSEAEIREKIGDHFDRTTVYRTLRSFLKEDVIHSISLDGGGVRYALSPHKEVAHSSHHVHFFCNDCNSVYCISHQAFETPELPKGFMAESFDLLIQGSCRKCKK